MAPRVVVEVELDKLDDIRTICFFGHAIIQADSSNLERVKDFVLQNFSRCTFFIRAADLKVDDIVALLDSGAAKVFLSKSQFEAVAAELQDHQRLVVTVGDPVKPEDDEHTSNSAAEDIVGFLREEHSFMRKLSPDVGIHYAAAGTLVLQAFARDPTNILRHAYVTCAEDTLFAARCAIGGCLTPIVRSSLFDRNREGDFVNPVEALLTHYLKSDRPDGLFSTVVVDERGICLGHVFSNEQSIKASLKHGRGIYWSRARGLWPKGDSSGDIQELILIDLDCDEDDLRFVVRQLGDGFCHLKTATCWGPYSGLPRLQKTLEARKSSAPSGSYTARLYSDPELLNAKIVEEASELCEATSKQEVATEAADLLYFALTKCVAAGVTLNDVEKNLDLKSMKVSRRKGDAKSQWAQKFGVQPSTNGSSEPTVVNGRQDKEELVKEAASVPKSASDPAGMINKRIGMERLNASAVPSGTIEKRLQRPSQRSTEEIMGIVKPIIDRVRTGGDAAVLEYTHKFEKATSLTTPVLHAPFPPELMQLPQETIDAIDLTFDNIRKFHSAQETQPLEVETMPGVVCSRFARPIERVGLYVPGGTAVLPSTALMLGVPAQVAGCATVVLASPSRADGTLTPEVVYVAAKIGARAIVLAGGAQAVAALAYGTESIPKVDKILGPGNQFVTAAKMLVSNDTTARVAIDMPAGPSEVLVVADGTANPAFVAADLLSQAEHGVDSQVVLIAVGLDEKQLGAIEDELERQANALPRVDIVRGAIEHSVTLVVDSVDEAMRWSNHYAPEHLILQVRDAEALVDRVQNAGSVFVGPWAPESVGDYSAGVNHSLREFLDPFPHHLFSFRSFLLRFFWSLIKVTSFS